MKVTYNNLFKNSFVISINDRLYLQFIEKLLNDGIIQNFPKLFNGFTLPNGTFKKVGFIKTNNILNCSLSHISLVKLALTLDLPYICIFEDDAIPCRDLLNKLNYYLSDIPDDIDMLKLGYIDRKVIKKYSNKFNIEDTVGSHAYIIFKKYYEKYIDNSNKNPIADCLVMNDNTANILTTNQPLFIQHNIDISKSLHGDEPNLRITNVYDILYIKDNFNI